MADIYMCGDSVQEYVNTVIAQWHPDLSLCEIGLVFRDKASKSGGVELPGKTKKASPLLRTLTGVNYQYVLEIAADFWMEFSDSQRVALIDHLLCHCLVEEEESSGELKYKIRKPNIQMFSEEVLRHGVWSPTTESEEEGGGASDIVVSDKLTDVFGAQADVEMSDPSEADALTSEDLAADILA